MDIYKVLEGEIERPKEKEGSWPLKMRLHKGRIIIERARDGYTFQAVYLNLAEAIWIRDEIDSTLRAVQSMAEV